MNEVGDRGRQGMHRLFHFDLSDLRQIINLFVPQFLHLKVGMTIALTSWRVVRIK